MSLCAPWVAAESISACAEDDIDAGRLERAALASSELLFVASGRQFHGLCTDQVRPCSTSRARWFGRRDIAAASALLLGDCCGTTDSPVCACSSHDSVRLPSTPVVEVTEILIDGDPVGAGGWRIVDDTWLIRTGDDPWPCCQDLALPATEPGTWQITYTWGTAVPTSGQLAAEILACELAKSWAGKKCNLPQRVTNVVRENVSMTVLDPFDFLDDGRLGIYEVDSFLGTFNPNKLQRPARLIDPRRSQPRRVR